MADALGFEAAIYLVAALTAGSGLVVGLTHASEARAGFARQPSSAAMFE